VGEQRALQGDDRAAGGQGVGDLGGEDGTGGMISGSGMHPAIMEGRCGRLVIPGSPYPHRQTSREPP
jgi:hypothetical protein